MAGYHDLKKETILLSQTVRRKSGGRCGRYRLFVSKEFAGLFKDDDPSQTFNTDETGVFYCALQKETHLF